MKSIRGRRHGIRALVTLILAAVVALVAVPATPVYANSGTMVCFPVYDGEGNLIDFHCFEIPVLYCEPPCSPFTIDFSEDIVLPVEMEFTYLDQLGRGLQLVGAATLERNAASARRLMDQARAQFLASAATMGRARVTSIEVGVADLRANRVLPNPGLAWLDAAGTDVGNGIVQMKAALGDPSPDPWVQAGLGFYQSAYRHLAYRL